MTSDHRLKSLEALNSCPAKNTFLHSEYLDPCLGPKPLKETQFCQLADELPIARVPPDVYNLVELKHPQMHDCFRTSCHLYRNYFSLGKRIIVNSPCYLCLTYVFSRDDMNTEHEERSNYQYLCNRR